MKFIILTITLALFYGCAGSSGKQTSVDMPSQNRASSPETPMDVPSWYANALPEDDKYIYSTGESTSRQMNIAVQKATQQARVNLGQQLTSSIQSLTESMVEEAGMEDNTQLTEFYSQASKNVSNTTLSGSAVLKKYPYKMSSGKYRAYILVGLKKEAFNMAAAKEVTSLINKNKEEAMYANFKKTQAFDRLEAAVGN
jgi:hypothetical protein